MNRFRCVATIAVANLLAIAGCASMHPTDPSNARTPADAFFEALKAECGRAFAGRVTVDIPSPTGPDPFAGQSLVMHVRDCPDAELRIPFHVGDDRSRTWILTRTTSGLRLKHDHRHADGSADKVTMYGGDARERGSAARQSFPVDEFSKAMFVREQLPASVANTWALEIVPGHTFVYELSRPGGRLFRVEFDLTTPVTRPPPSWGASP